MKKEKLVPVLGTDFQARYADFLVPILSPDMLMVVQQFRPAEVSRGVLDMLFSQHLSPNHQCATTNFYGIHMVFCAKNAPMNIGRK